MSKSRLETLPTILEPAREVPVAREADVLVCGGGPAGIAAAFTAARAGAKVLLLERNAFLGGVWTAGALSIIIDAQEKTGLIRELLQRLEKRGATAPVMGNMHIYTIEAMKSLLDEMVEETGIDVQLYTQVVAVARDGDRITGVFTESKSGREFIRAKVVIDTTGDGDVGAQAGCGFEYGRESDGKVQPMTLYGRIGGYHGTEMLHIEPLLSIARKAGYEPSYERVTLIPQPGQPGVFMLMATHMYGSGLDVRNLTRAEFQARSEIRHLVELYKKHAGPDWKDVFLIDTGPCIGIREARRIRGRHYLTVEELQSGDSLPDGICHVRFLADIHHPDKKEGGGLTHVHFPSYDIPYGCLVARDADNLLMAGRCISGDHIAHASYRVTGDAVATGEAAGLAATLCVEQDILPPHVDVPQLQAKLLEMREACRG
ncbi:FAD-dependent oxidoreductase [Ruficoccus sp. ZRK36]|uniref:FAD-dependent oxidoreductase n=1 Tax=Ruficoccus sp. ZRK36 TaxID=2866311 RepID=UPI001C7389F7|nr:FAD-dependent oxidoreductase [Ruficoccus sp. ZRK36]QYY34836.1 FAD-dependent oxidoreductase [Ruficoccus sp. ZRK36]